MDTVRLLHFLTRLPLPSVSYKPLNDVLWVLPLAAAILACLAWSWVQLVTLLFSEQNWIAAGLILAGLTWATGALHDDALSDTADGLGGGWSKDRKLAIMKDSQIGAYGVSAMILSFGLRWAAWSSLLTTQASGIIWIFWLILTSRFACLPSMALQSQARATGQAKLAGRLDLLVVLSLAPIVLIVGFWLYGLMSLLAFIPALCMAVMAQRQIGGVTGDIYGAQIMLTEIAILLVWVTSL